MRDLIHKPNCFPWLFIAFQKVIPITATPHEEHHQKDFVLHHTHATYTESFIQAQIQHTKNKINFYTNKYYQEEAVAYQKLAFYLLLLPDFSYQLSLDTQDALKKSHTLLNISDCDSETKKLIFADILITEAMFLQRKSEYHASVKKCQEALKVVTNYGKEKHDYIHWDCYTALALSHALVENYYDAKKIYSEIYDHCCPFMRMAIKESKSPAFFTSRFTANISWIEKENNLGILSFLNRQPHQSELHFETACDHAEITKFGLNIAIAYYNRALLSLSHKELEKSIAFAQRGLAALPYEKKDFAHPISVLLKKVSDRAELMWEPGLIYPTQ